MLLPLLLAAGCCPSITFTCTCTCISATSCGNGIPTLNWTLSPLDWTGQWKLEHRDAQTLNWIQDKSGTSLSGSFAVDPPPTKTMVYRLSAKCKPPGMWKEKAIVLWAGPPVVTLTANPSTIKQNETSTLTGTVVNANKWKIIDGANNTIASDTVPLSHIVTGQAFNVPPETASLSKTTTYTLTAWNDCGETSATVTVVVTCQQCTPVINSFKASVVLPDPHDSCTPGTTFNLSWDVTNDCPMGPNPNFPFWNPAKPVCISLLCNDLNSNTPPTVYSIWSPNNLKGSSMYTLPSNFTSSGKDCKFCLWTYDCAGENVTWCIPICCPLCVSDPPMKAVYGCPCAKPGKPSKYCWEYTDRCRVPVKMTFTPDPGVGPYNGTKDCINFSPAVSTTYDVEAFFDAPCPSYQGPHSVWVIPDTLKINSFTAVPENDTDNCSSGSVWNLSWDVCTPMPDPAPALPYEQNQPPHNVPWEPNTSVSVSLFCKDTQGNLMCLWNEQHGLKDSITCTLPQLPPGTQCEFCLTASDCACDNVTQCIPICDNMIYPSEPVLHACASPCADDGGTIKLMGWLEPPSSTASYIWTGPHGLVYGGSLEPVDILGADPSDNGTYTLTVMDQGWTKTATVDVKVPCDNCTCEGWNPVTVSWPSASGINTLTGSCGQQPGLIIPEMCCDTTVKVSSSANCTCPQGQLFDVYLLADTTISMESAINKLKQNRHILVNALDCCIPKVRIGVGYYQDFETQYTSCFTNLLSPINYDYPVEAETKINSWLVGTSGDPAEGQLYALYQLTDDSYWRPDAKRIIVWFGDNPGHEPIDANLAGTLDDLYISDVISALNSAGPGGTTVLAISMTTGFPINWGLDYSTSGLTGSSTTMYTSNQIVTSGQATAITNATGGKYLPGATTDQILQAIIGIVKGYTANLVTQVPASYEFEPSTPGVYPVQLTANCDNVTCPPCDIDVLVRDCTKPDASVTVEKTSDCPQIFRLTGKPDNMIKYEWKDPSGNVVGNKQTLDIETTDYFHPMPKGDYTYTLTVTDSNGCTDNATGTITAGFEDCPTSPTECKCEFLHIQMPWDTTQKCRTEPCNCVSIPALDFAWGSSCWPGTKSPPPCPPPDASLSVDPPCACIYCGSTEFNVNLTGTVSGANSWTLTASAGGSSNVIASGQNLNTSLTYTINKNYSGNNLGPNLVPITFTLTANGPCGSDTATVTWEFCPHELQITSFIAEFSTGFSICGTGAIWDLEWHLKSTNAPVGWEPCVVISIRCPDFPNTPDVPVGTFSGLDGHTSFKLPKTCCDCYFLLHTEDCAGNDIEAKVFFAGGEGPETPAAATPCPGNCDCLTEREALDLGYTNLCQEETCSAPGEPEKHCYSRCPEGCYCVTEKEAEELGYTISCSDEICDSSGKEPKYCFSPPIQPCSQKCQCLTQAQAKEYGYTDAQRCQTVPCKQDAQGKDMYCYPKPKAPVVDVTADRSFVTQGDAVRVCWKVTGEGITEVLFSAGGEKPNPVDPQGCKTFRPTQQTRYLVTAKNAAGSGQDAVTVGVGQPPPVEEACPTINSFIANCPPVTGGQAEAVYVQPCTISWSVTGPAGTTVTISGIGAVGMSGSTQVQRCNTCTYTLTATYQTCTRTATVQVPR